MKNDNVAILDFGSSKITCMAATRVSDKGDFIIKAVGQSMYNGFDDKSFYEPETIKSAILGAIAQVENKTKTTIKDIYVGVPGVFCAVTTGESSLTFHSKKKVGKDDVNELIDKADIFGCGDDYVALGGKPAYFILDDAIKTVDPIGNIANKLTALVSFSFMKRYFRDTVSPVLQKKGIKNVTYLNTCDAQALYCARSMFIGDYAMVIDVGHLTTNVSLISGNALLFQRTFALGSGYLSGDLCQVLGCDFKFAMGALEKINLNLEIQDGDAYSVNGRMIDAKQANEIVRARIGQIAQYVIKSFSFCDKEIPVTTPIVLTGGGLTNLRGGADCLAYYLGKQIKVYDSLNPQTKRNAYTSCYGLIAEAVKENKSKGGFWALFKK